MMYKTATDPGRGIEEAHVRNRWLSLLVSLVAVAEGALGQAPAPKQEAAPKAPAAAKPAPKPAVKKSAAVAAGLTVEDVARMLEAKLSESIIVKQIGSNGKKFPLTPDDLIRLKTAGASDGLLTAMMDGLEALPKPAPPTEPAPPPPSAAPPTPAAATHPPQVPWRRVGTPSAAPPTPAAATAPDAPRSSQKKRLAVEEFDYSTVKTAVQTIFGTEQNIGKGIRALFTHRLTQGAQLTVVERAKLDVVLKEQDIGGGNRVKAGTGARIGRIKGADAILMGDIVAFGRDDRKKGIKGGAAIPGIIGGVFSNWLKSEKAVVVISYRLVDSETSEVIHTGEARGESVRKSKGWGALAGALGVAGGVQIDMTSSNFAETIIGEATIDCVNKLAETMNQKVPSLPAKKIEVEARVADVSGGTVTITSGSNDGVQVGDKFAIERVVKEVVDPVTKGVLDLQTVQVGDLVVSTVRERISIGTFTGTEAPQVTWVARKQ